MNSKIITTAIMMAAFIFSAPGSDANAQIKKSKELEEEVKTGG